MDDFTPHGDTFDMVLANLEKMLNRCKQTHLSLIKEKCHMTMDEGVVLGCYLCFAGIQVYPTKIEVILKIPPLKSEKEVHSLLGKTGYYLHFSENYSRTA
jgi:hypothetical protein